MVVVLVSEAEPGAPRMAVSRMYPPVSSPTIRTARSLAIAIEVVADSM
jgi:hypothetical protein